MVRLSKRGCLTGIKYTALTLITVTLLLLLVTLIKAFTVKEVTFHSRYNVSSHVHMLPEDRTMKHAETLAKAIQIPTISYSPKNITKDALKNILQFIQNRKFSLDIL